MSISHKGGRQSADETGTPYDTFEDAPMASGGALVDPGNPFARSYLNPYITGPAGEGAQDERPNRNSMYRDSNTAYQNNGAIMGLTDHEVYYYGNRENLHVHTINDKAEQVAWSNQGPNARQPTNGQRGTQPTEPNNNPPDDPRIVPFGGTGYMFLRQWIDTIRDQVGFNGAHISLSDVHVIQPVGGMAPQHRKNMRNTYRIAPEPWDLNLVDMDQDPYQNAGSAPQDAYIGEVSGRSYRLG